MAERTRVLFVGPDVPGGMATTMSALRASPLAEDYGIEMVATHRGTDPLRRLPVFLGALVRIALWRLRGGGIVHVHSTVRGSMYRKSVVVLWAKALRSPVVLHMHSGPGDIASFRASLSGRKLDFVRRAFRRADRVLAVSAASAAGLREAFGAEGVIVVPNPAPAPPAAVDRSGRDGDPLLLFLGGFANPVKGGEQILAALRRPELEQQRAVLAGPGELPADGAELVEERPEVEWRGWLDDAAKAELLAAADVFVLSSTSEGLPMALLEAMAWGLAIVATAVGGVPDVAADGEEALIVAPGDVDALAAAIARLAADPGLRARLGAAARARVAEFSPDRVAAALIEVYASLVGPRP